MKTINVDAFRDLLEERRDSAKRVYTSAGTRDEHLIARAQEATLTAIIGALDSASEDVSVASQAYLDDLKYRIGRCEIAAGVDTE